MKGHCEVDESIFKAYDIRGIYPIQIDEKTACLIGRAFSSFLKCRNVCIGRDCRLSSKRLFDALSKGITEQGADVIDIGEVSINELYFAVSHFNFDSGIMITASHNPKEYNGFKLVREKSIPISEETGLREILNLAVNNNFKEHSKEGSVSKRDFQEDFIKYLIDCTDYYDFSEMKNLLKSRNLRVCMDASNGMAGAVAKILFSRLGIELIPINFEPDGLFPNHPADPLKEENKAQLIESVRENKADFGIIWDVDADRCFFVDEKGNGIPGDFMTGILAKAVLEKKPNAAILYDLRASRFVREIIEENHGKAVMCRVGHSFIKKYMREHNSPFAGELSGHYYYKVEDSYFENSYISCLQAIWIVLKENKSMGKILSPSHKYFISGEINFESEHKDKILSEAESHFSREKGASVSHLDGLSMEFPKWRFNIRKSNTEPLIRLNLEADSGKMLAEKLREIEKFISEADKIQSEKN
ncbi:MAG: phosphomannomutase/phosphoglucomutase [Candidatus Woesearchaeota archaeon]|nr:phosphomannomutase/phosphoglucomutase [Candidatus Woesearchaeota archaeon]